MKKRLFILDTDTGLDDALMLIAAMSIKELEILGITSVNGNVSEQYTCHNNLALMTFLNKKIPVCHGAIAPLYWTRNSNAESFIHGDTGMGNIELREIDEKLLLKEIASEFIYETAKKYSGELEILATGPLTNIAIALIEHPDLNKHIKHIYFMGGSLTIGNVNNSAEFNIWADPEAAQVVFNSGIKTTMVGLNVSNYAYLDINDVDILRTSKLKVSDLLADIITYMINRPNQDIKVARMHDPLALAAAFYPECLEFREYRIDAECNGFYTKGRTAIDLFHKNDSIANVSIAISLKQELFKKWLLAKFIKTAEEII